jgi:ribonuclease VapC
MSANVARVVLDASAVMAILKLEDGAEIVLDHLKDAAISAINVSEVAAKLVEKGQSIAQARRTIGMLGLEVETVDERQAYVAAALRPGTRSKGLSLGDRHCLALAAKLGATVLTADKAWGQIECGLDIKLIR